MLYVTNQAKRTPDKDYTHATLRVDLNSTTLFRVTRLQQVCFKPTVSIPYIKCRMFETL